MAHHRADSGQAPGRTRPELSPRELAERLRNPGYQPARAEAAPLMDALATAERSDAEVIERALARLGDLAADEAIRRFPEARPPARARLCRLVGRLASEGGRPAATRGSVLVLVRWLMDRLGDEDAPTRRQAAIALGKQRESSAPAHGTAPKGVEDGGEDAIERALIDRWHQDSDASVRRAVAAALGKVGSSAALAALAAFKDIALPDGDAELRRIVDEAVLKLERTRLRVVPGRIVAERPPPEPTVVHVTCRHGLAALVAEELAALRARKLDDATCALTLERPLSALFSSHVMLRFGIPLHFHTRNAPPGSVTTAAPALQSLPPVGRAVAAAISSPAARRLMAALTEGPLRYRIEWSGAGLRRSLTFRVAEAVAQLAPELVNDPTQPLWEVIVREGSASAPDVELWPRGLPDLRFAWRVADVPASSHPTIAAALAHIAGVSKDDVVWDPFVGAGAELALRARLGPARLFIGTDTDDRALAAARKNLDAAGVAATLTRADARTYRPAVPPTLILTNPPMGRRLGSRAETGPLLTAFLTHAAKVLAPGGRLVWISPRARDTRATAAQLGFQLTRSQRVDMGGFFAEIQMLRLGSTSTRSTSQSAGRRHDP